MAVAPDRDPGPSPPPLPWSQVPLEELLDDLAALGLEEGEEEGGEPGQQQQQQQQAAPGGHAGGMVDDDEMEDAQIMN